MFVPGRAASTWSVAGLPGSGGSLQLEKLSREQYRGIWPLLFKVVTDF